MTQRRRSVVPIWVLLSIALVACSSKDMSDGETTPNSPAGSSGGGNAAVGGDSGGSGGRGGGGAGGTGGIATGGGSGGSGGGGAGGTSGRGGTGGSGGSPGIGVAPSGGPRPCGCAADQICVAWENIGSVPSGVNPDCWKAPPACVTDTYTQGVESMCGCFNPCPAWGGSGEGPACFDRRTSPGALKGAEDARCILRGS
jgi:hypothetical protein